ncbi:hypothetical protein P8452_09642 [Trifolium repens]|nr:hypothetical protein P8452_09642 [Trifolium repens]
MPTLRIVEMAMTIVEQIEGQYHALIIITVARIGNRGNVTNMSELNALELRDLSNNNFGGLIPLTFGTLMNIGCSRIMLQVGRSYCVNA